MLQKAGIENNQIGGLAEVYFGFFTEPSDGCRPRKKALVLQRAAGGMEDLSKVGLKVSQMKKQ